MDTEKIESFFFEAMNQGYASSASKIKDMPLMGTKSIRYQRDGMTLLDYWFGVPGSKASYGTTAIWISQEPELILKPVWVMHYGGWYEEWVIPFLKRALARNYQDNIFLGGRGPKMLEGEDHTVQYINQIEKNNFADFKGSEKIISTSHQTGFSVGQKLGARSPLL